MSRVGRLPVQIPKGVTVNVDTNVLTVEGPKGKLSQSFRPEVTIRIEDGSGIVERKNESKKAKSLHGLYRKLLSNMVTGVSQGFSKTLLVNGVGYRVEMSGQNVLLNLGFSNPVEYVVPEGITVAVDGPNKLTVSGIDRHLVGQVAANIRGLRPPEPYKGKGIRYEDEYVRRKVGKSGIK
mgnify:CR=1 FL=1